MRINRACLATATLFLVASFLPSLVVAQITDLRERDTCRDLSRARLPVTLCHIPPEAPENAHTIVVNSSAVPPHLDHGDSLGECPGECDGPPSPVPKTGSIECWEYPPGVAPFIISCAGTGTDGEYQVGVSAYPRFTDNSDGTVTDNLTGLNWLKDAECFEAMNWMDALSQASTLADGACGLTDASVAGDWRLPNVRELLSLIDYGQLDPALPLGHPFLGVQEQTFWTSTSTAGGPPAYAWTVRMTIGVAYDYQQQQLLLVWPVRGGM